jgi:hypothetical protein
MALTFLETRIGYANDSGTRASSATPKNNNARTVAADKAVQRGRLSNAKQFPRVADDARELAKKEDIRDAAVTLYVHAGIAAAEAICAAILGIHAKGPSHQDAVALLSSVDKQASSSLNLRRPP